MEQFAGSGGWLSIVGGYFGAQYPAEQAHVRAHGRTFKAFVLAQADQLPLPADAADLCDGDSFGRDSFGSGARRRKLKEENAPFFGQAPGSPLSQPQIWPSSPPSQSVLGLASMLDECGRSGSGSAESFSLHPAGATTPWGQPAVLAPAMGVGSSATTSSFVMGSPSGARIATQGSPGEAQPSADFAGAAVTKLREMQARIVELEVAVANLRMARLCQICVSRESNALVMPCLHSRFCVSCTRGRGRCPVCDTPISGVLELRL